MFRAAAKAGERYTARNLRPASYKLVLSGLRAVLGEVRVYDLWQMLFGVDMRGRRDVAMVEWDLAVRVNEELFPFCLERLEPWGERWIEYPVPVSGWRIPFEAAAIEDLAGWEQAAAAVLQWNYLGLDGEVWYDWVACPPDIWWLKPWATDGAWRVGMGRLARQGPEWDGLANLIWITMRYYASPFLGLPGPGYVEEYQDVDYFWTERDLILLAMQWQVARPTIERIKLFVAWFKAQPEVMEAHLEVMEMLEAVSGR